MTSSKRQKSSTPSTLKVSSKLSVKDPRSRKETTKSKLSKTTSKLNTPPSPPYRTGLTPQEVWELAFQSYIPDSVTRLRHLNTKTLEGAGKYSPYKPYHVMVGYHGNKDEPEACEVAVLALYPGITLGQAQKAAELLWNKLPKSHSEGGQQPYNLELRMAIRFNFIKIAQDESFITRLSAPGKEPVKLPHNKNRRGAAICRAIAGHFDVSETFVKKCYRDWLDQQGRPKKTYQIYPKQTDRKD